MKKGRKIKTELRELLELAEPVEPERSGPSAREIKIRIQIACYAGVAAFSLAVFLFNSARLMAQFEGHTSRPPETATPADQAPAFQKVSFSDAAIPAIGKITWPQAQTVTGRTITVKGFTQDVPIDTPFIWLIVDVPSIGRCWPKRPAIQPNGNFQATIFEGGSGQDFTISLYAVGYGLNKFVEQWLADGTLGGMPMLPPQYRLDSVQFSLNGV